MEKLDLSTFAKEIKHDYDSVVSGDKSFAIFTTLKDSSLKPTHLGDGDITDFVSEFEEGSVQFGIIGVNPFGSDVKKLVLLGWCPDSAPIKSKVSYASNLSSVGKILHYHVEITARDSDDLDVGDIMKTVSNASGARYSIQSLTPQKSSSSFKPKPKPATVGLSNNEISNSKSSVVPSIIKPKPAFPVKKVDSTDDWGDEEEIKERDFSKQPLENLPSAYKPTKVDIHALRKSEPSAQSPELKPATISINPSGGLSSLPKPKPSHSVLSRYNQEVVKPEFGSKAPVFDSNPSRDSSKLVGGLSRNFGAQNGKTPAQLWAEKKGQYKEVANDEKPVNSTEFEKNNNDEELNVGNVKDKFEKIHLEAEKEKQEEIEDFEAKSTISSFPPPPARETVSSFPPPPARNVFNKFQEKEPENDNEAWGDEDEDEDVEDKSEEKTEESQPLPLPKRNLPPAFETPSALPPRPVPVAPVAEQEPTPAEVSVETPSDDGREAIAEYDYEKDEDNEIDIHEGEKITNIEFIDEDWWKGTNSNGETGLFPGTYVNLIERTSNAQEPVVKAELKEESKPSGLSAVAEYDYSASEDNELTFNEGDVITDIDQVDDVWWLGSFNGERKLFPANYVTLNN